MNEGRPYLQMWRGVWVPFCKIAIVAFLSVRYKLDDLYCRTAGTPSSPSLVFIRVEKYRVEIYYYIIYTSFATVLTVEPTEYLEYKIKDGLVCF